MVPRRSRIIVGMSTALVAILAVTLPGADDGRAIRDGFETPRPSWRQEQTDATVNLLAHERSTRAAHEGRTSEHFRFVAGAGSSFFYSYPLPEIPATDALRASLYVRSNRAGVRLSGRVVLPKDTDPDTGEPSFVTITGTSYDAADRWQRLELANLRPSIERQARVLRAATRRPVSLEGAYLERLVINLFGGVGETDVYIDELSVSPVPAELATATDRLPTPETPGPSAPPPEAAAPPRGGAKVVMERNRLRKKAADGRYYDWFATAIHAPGADVVKLRHAGFDVLAEDLAAEAARVESAIKWGFLLLPRLDGTLEGRPIDAERMIASAQGYPFRDAVAFWNVGEHLGRPGDARDREAERERIRATVTGLRKLPGDASGLATASVDGDLALYADGPKNLAMMAIRPNAWGSAQDPLDTYSFLKQRGDLTALANPDNLLMAWFPATPPPAVQAAIWGQDVPPAWGALEVQPEQLRLFTYLALGAGYRGIGFEGNADLTRNAGRPLLIEMAFLNEEIDLCESILANGTEPGLFRTYRPDPSLLPMPGSQVNMRVRTEKEYDPLPTIRVSSITTRDNKGRLLLVADFAEGAQFQPPQMAMNDLKIVIPAPESAQAFEISPGEVRPLNRERVPGGMRVTLPEFSATALVLVTTDQSIPGRMEAAIRRVRPLAVQMAIEQAELRYHKVAEINGLLVGGGLRLYDRGDPKNPPLPAGAPEPNEEAELLGKAEAAIKAAREALEREDYPLAWSEARRAHRPLRHLMRSQWQKTAENCAKVFVPPDPKPDPGRRGRTRPKETVELLKEKQRRTPVIFSPVAFPFLVSYNTLPLADYWIHWASKPFGRNLIPSGSFDDHGSLEAAGWVDQSYAYPGLKTTISTVTDENDQRRRVLKFDINPADAKKLDTLAPFLDFPAAAVRSPGVPMERDQLFRISVLVKKVLPTPPGAGGVIITDSIGGEALQFRTSAPLPKLSRVVLYRRAPSRGTLTVTLGAAGFGEYFFDDFRIETVVDRPGDATDEYAGRPGAPIDGPPGPSTAERPRARSSR